MTCPAEHLSIYCESMQENPPALPATMRTAAYITLILSLCAPITVAAQSSRFVVTATAGSYQANVHALLHAFYPELQAEARLVGIPHSSAVLRAGVFYGYYNSGADEPTISCLNCVTYSASGHTVGARLVLSLFDGKMLPVGISAGLARQFTTARYVGGSALDFIQIPIPDRLTINSNVAIFGLQVRVPVYRALKVHLAAQRLIPLPMRGDIVENIAYGDRHLLQAGLAYGIH